jgi:hypothetical protein
MGEKVKMPTIFHKGQRLKYAFHLTARRKTIALKVHRNGDIELRAPKSVKPTQLRQFVGARAAWILERKTYFADLARKFSPKEFKNGETFSALGRNYRLKIERRPGLSQPVCQAIGRRLQILVNGHAGEELERDIQSSLKDWYSNLTEEKVRFFVSKHAWALSVAPKTLKVVEQEKRWASCSRNGDIRCNWRLAMMPLPVLEYIVVHELCHLKIPDHSARFWRALKSVLPDHDRQREWLRQNGSRLSSLLESQ